MKTFRQAVNEGPIGHIAKGGFHRWLGKKQGEPITSADIQKGLAAGGHAAKMANFARNAKKFHHEEVENDAVEPIVELSKKTLGSYIKKSAERVDERLRRRKGITKAVNKLTKEETIVEGSAHHKTHMLVHDRTGKEIKIGSKVKDFRGDEHKVHDFEVPHHSGSTGRVYVTGKSQVSDEPRAFFPGVINAKIVKRKTVKEETNLNEKVVEPGSIEHMRHHVYNVHFGHTPSGDSHHYHCSNIGCDTAKDDSSSNVYKYRVLHKNGDEIHRFHVSSTPGASAIGLNHGVDVKHIGSYRFTKNK